MCIYIYVFGVYFLYICIIYIYIHIYVYIYRHIYIHIHIYIYMYRFTFIIYMYVFICTLYLYILTHKWFASSSRKHVPKLTVFQDTCSVAKFPGVLSLDPEKNRIWRRVKAFTDPGDLNNYIMAIYGLNHIKS